MSLWQTWSLSQELVGEWCVQMALVGLFDNYFQSRWKSHSVSVTLGTWNLRHLKSCVQNMCVCEMDTHAQTVPNNFTAGGRPCQTASRPSTLQHRLNSMKTSASPPQCAPAGNGARSTLENLAVVVYQQLNREQHAVNRNILSNAPSGADSKGTTGWALATAGLQRVWQITLPLSNKRLKCSPTTTSSDENAWITSSSGLPKCIYWRLGLHTRGLLRACGKKKEKKPHVYPEIWRPFNWLLECTRIRKTNRQRQ